MQPNSLEYSQSKLNLSTYNRILKNSIISANKLHYGKCFSRYKSDIKNTWKTINSLLCKSKNEKDLPPFFKINDAIVSDTQTIAQEFNEYFTNLGPTLANDIATPLHKSFHDYLTAPSTANLSFDYVSETNIAKIIDNFPPKTSSGHDNISLKLVKHCKNILVNPITLIINQMFSTNVFPDRLKIAKVKPLFKKDDESSLQNYRPISLLPTISKIFEKSIYLQTYNHFLVNDLFYKSQYGFRGGHSTELAALEVVSKIIDEMDKGLLPLNIYLDLSKAFDTIDHQILLEKLAFNGIRGKSLDLFKSYLTSRKQYVEIDGKRSSSTNIKTGVPQGSILGPLLFIIYINDLPMSSQLFEFIIYADDTTLSGILKTRYTDIDILHINSELDKISDWLKTNKLSLNVNKTKMMLFYQPQRKVDIPKLKINNTEITIVDEFDFLGITLDKHLTWKPHIHKISNKISKTLGILNRIKTYLPQNAKLNIYNSLVLSYLHYGILLWGHANDCNRPKLLQKKAVRIITNSNYLAHSEPIFKTLNLLKLEDILKVNILKFYYQHENKNLPIYFQNIEYNPSISSHHYNTRKHEYVYYVKHEFAKKSLKYTIPKLINETPTFIKDKVHTHSLIGFKSYTKNYYLSYYSLECSSPQNCYICQNSLH